MRQNLLRSRLHVCVGWMPLPLGVAIVVAKITGNGGSLGEDESCSCVLMDHWMYSCEQIDVPAILSWSVSWQMYLPRNKHPQLPLASAGDRVRAVLGREWPSGVEETRHEGNKSLS